MLTHTREKAPAEIAVEKSLRHLLGHTDYRMIANKLEELRQEAEVQQIDWTEGTLIYRRANSTSIRIVRYNFAHEAMLIQFVSGGTYVYKGVSLDEFTDFVQSVSLGSYFAAYIKGRYGKTVKLGNPIN